MIQPGDIIAGTYQIIEQIGKGASGVVYKAYHLRLQQYVAMKRIKDAEAHKLRSARIEMQILNRLKHTYLPKVYDFLDVPEGVFTVIDFIEGVPMDYYIKQGYRIEQKQILIWAKQLCEALNYLHSMNPPIIHSDIKPANIMVTPEGNVCLIDFNISLDSRSSSQISGMTAGYAPPEQYANTVPVQNPDGTGSTYQYQMETPLDARSDIYSLGATFYHLMTGVKPAKDASQVVPITSYQLNYSDTLLQIIEKMMQVNPNDRYQSASQVLEALKNIYQMDKRYKEYRTKQHITSILFTVLIAGFSLLSVFGFRQMSVEHRSEYQQMVAEGDEARISGKYGEALDIYDDAITMYGDEISAYRGKMLLFADQGHYESCIAFGNQILTSEVLAPVMESHPKNAADIHFLIANSWFEKKNYVNAAQHYQEAIDRDGKNPEYYRDYAISLARMMQTDQAMEVLNQAKEAGLATDSVQLVEAELLLSDGQWQKAADQFNKIIHGTQSEDVRKRAYLLCADAYERGGEIDQKIEVLMQGEKALPAGSGLVFTLKLAESYLWQAQHNPDKASAYVPKALEAYEKAEKMTGLSVTARLNCAAAYELLKDFDKAEGLLLRLKEEQPEDYRIYMRLAFLSAKKEGLKDLKDRDYTEVTENYDKAVVYYQKAKQEGVSDSQMQLLEQMVQDILTGGWMGQLPEGVLS